MNNERRTINSWSLWTTLVVLCALCHGFSIETRKSTKTTSKVLLARKGTNEESSFVPIQSGSGNSLEGIFKGGAFEDDSEQILADASKIASKIRSVKELGWSSKEKRRGKKRPRHRAWGGEKEEPVQKKPNYDEKKENCPEKWLTLEDFQTKTRSTGPASDTVFVALARGAKYAEREDCERTISEWYSSSQKGKGKFNEGLFVKSVEKGRNDLFIGWGSFVFANAFFASCIIFPTNPGAKALESLVDYLKDSL